MAYSFPTTLMLVPCLVLLLFYIADQEWAGQGPPLASMTHGSLMRQEGLVSQGARTCYVMQSLDQITLTILTKDEKQN